MIDPLKHQAVIFDLDGVIVKTTDLHASTIKCVLDEFLAGQKPFDPVQEYRQYMDGRVGFEAFGNFLQSRGIMLPQEKLHELADKKTALFLEAVDQKGVETYPSTITLIKKLKEKKMKIALASSSRSGKFIIEKLNLSSFFDTLLDGKDAIKEGIKGKPAPDLFLRASEILGVKPQNSVVIEDSLSGVEAGKRGNYALVIGVNRSNQKVELLKKGAHHVVLDLEEIIF